MTIIEQRNAHLHSTAAVKPTTAIFQIRLFDLFFTAFLALLAFSLFCAYLATRADLFIDFRLHHEMLAQFVSGEWTLGQFLGAIPHFLYHLIVYSGSLLLNRADWLVGYAVVIAAWTVLGLLYYFFLLRASNAVLPQSRHLVAALLTLALLFSAPLFFSAEGHVYFGFIHTNVYHSPTVLLLRPFAIAIFCLGMATFTSNAQSSSRLIPLLVLLTILSILAKPSFAMAFVPALVLLTGVRLALKQPIRWAVLLSIALPATTLLGAQFLFFEGQGLALNFLGYLREYNAAGDWLLKIVLSAAFPIVVTLLWLRESARSTLMQLAWTTFLIGIALAYLLVEGGGRTDHGNFVWSAQIGALILFFASAIFLVQQAGTWRSPHHHFTWRFILVVVTLAAHVTHGVVWLLMNFGILQIIP